MKGTIPKPEVDGQEIGRNATLEHIQVGAIIADAFMHDGDEPKVRFRVRSEREPAVYLEYRESTLQNQWGETVHSDPSKLSKGNE